MKITRDVISDLWPLYQDGTTSADTNALIEEFLRQDPEFSKNLSIENKSPHAVVPELTADKEATIVNKIKSRARIVLISRVLAYMWTGFAFGRIVSDTSFDVSPRNFIITASIATVFWIAHLIIFVRMERLKQGNPSSSSQTSKICG